MGSGRGSVPLGKDWGSSNPPLITATVQTTEGSRGDTRGVVPPWDNSQSDLALAAVLVSDFPDFLSLFLAPSDLAESEVGVDVDDLRESVA